MSSGSSSGGGACSHAPLCCARCECRQSCRTCCSPPATSRASPARTKRVPVCHSQAAAQASRGRRTHVRASHPQPLHQLLRAQERAQGGTGLRYQRHVRHPGAEVAARHAGGCSVSVRHGRTPARARVLRTCCRRCGSSLSPAPATRWWAAGARCCQRAAACFARRLPLRALPGQRGC